MLLPESQPSLPHSHPASSCNREGLLEDRQNSTIPTLAVIWAVVNTLPLTTSFFENFVSWELLSQYLSSWGFKSQDIAVHNSFFQEMKLIGNENLRQYEEFHYFFVGVLLLQAYYGSIRCPNRFNGCIPHEYFTTKIQEKNPTCFFLALFFSLFVANSLLLHYSFYHSNILISVVQNKGNRRLY